MSRHDRTQTGVKTKMTRRRFLQASGASIAAVVASSRLIGSARAESDLESTTERIGVLTDLSRCVGCRACEVGCNQVNDLSPPETPFAETAVFENERRPTIEAFTVVNRYQDADQDEAVFRKAQCMHCNEPACVSVCPAAAMVKTPEGPVIWDEKVCMGCRYCMMACPFNIPAYEYDNAFTPRIRKCTMCYERVVKEGGVPGCVASCPTNALEFGKRVELIAIARKRIADNPEKYVNHIYGEHEAGGTGWLYLSPVPFEDVGLPDVGEEAIGELTWGFLTTIGVADILLPLTMIAVYRLTQRRNQTTEQKAHNNDE